MDLMHEISGPIRFEPLVGYFCRNARVAREVNRVMKAYGAVAVFKCGAPGIFQGDLHFIAIGGEIIPDLDSLTTHWLGHAPRDTMYPIVWWASPGILEDWGIPEGTFDGQVGGVKTN